MYIVSNNYLTNYSLNKNIEGNLNNTNMIQFLVYFKDQNGHRIYFDEFLNQYKSITIDEFYFFDGGFVLLYDGKILYEAMDMYDHFVGILFLLNLWYYCKDLDIDFSNRQEADLLLKYANNLDVPNGICQLQEMSGAYLSFEEFGELVGFRNSEKDVLVVLEKDRLVEPIESVLDPYMRLVNKLFFKKKGFEDSNLGRFTRLWGNIR